MAKISDKQLIESIGQLKEIKPREEWVVLAKSQIFATAQKKTAKITAQKINFSEILSSLFIQRKLAYSLAALAFIVIGLTAYMSFVAPTQNVGQFSIASSDSELKNSVAMFSTNIDALAEVSKSGNKNEIPTVVLKVKANVSELAKNLKDDSVKGDQETIRKIATGLKTLATVLESDDLSKNQDMKDLYQTVVQSQLEDLKKSTLTEAQKKTLDEIQKMYDKSEYAEALEKILLISK